MDRGARIPAAHRRRRGHPVARLSFDTRPLHRIDRSRELHLPLAQASAGAAGAHGSLISFAFIVLLTGYGLLSEGFDVRPEPSRSPCSIRI